MSALILSWRQPDPPLALAWRGLDSGLMAAIQRTIPPSPIAAVIGPAGASSTPGGSTGQVQFNHAGAFDGDAALFWDFTNRRLGVGTSTPNAPFEVQPVAGATGSFVHIDGYDTGSGGTNVNAYIDISSYNNDGYGDGITMYYRRGTLASPAANQIGDLLCTAGSGGYDGANTLFGGGYSTVVDGAVSPGVLPTAFVIATGTGNPVERMRVTSAGRVGIGTTAPRARQEVVGSVVISGPPTVVSGFYYNQPYGLFIEPGTVTLTNANRAVGAMIAEVRAVNTATSGYVEADGLGFIVAMDGGTNPALEADVYGIVGNVSRDSATDVSANGYMYSLLANINHVGTLNTAAKTLEAVNLHAVASVDAGTITDLKNLFTVCWQSAGSTVTNYYDAHLVGISSGGTVTNKWGVYQSAADHKNFFAGKVGVKTTAPQYDLHVAGTFGITPGASVTPVNIGDLVFEATSNTSVKIKLKGSDGVVRSVTLTLA